MANKNKVDRVSGELPKKKAKHRYEPKHFISSRDPSPKEVAKDHGELRADDSRTHESLRPKGTPDRHLYDAATTALKGAAYAGAYRLGAEFAKGLAAARPFDKAASLYRDVPGWLKATERVGRAVQAMDYADGIREAAAADGVGVADYLAENAGDIAFDAGMSAALRSPRIPFVPKMGLRAVDILDNLTSNTKRPEPRDTRQASKGGETVRKSYAEWVKDVNPNYLSDNYDLESAYKHLPTEQLERWKRAVNSEDPKKFLDYRDPRTGEYPYHLQSVAPLENGDYIFLKKGDEKTNPEVRFETDAYRNGETGLEKTHDLVYDKSEGRYFYRAKPQDKRDTRQAAGGGVSNPQAIEPSRRAYEASTGRALLNAVESTRGTEFDVLKAMYPTKTEDEVRNIMLDAFKHRLTGYDFTGRGNLRNELIEKFQRGEMDLESLDIPRFDGTLADPGNIFRSRKARNTTSHRGEFRIVGHATRGGGNDEQEVQRINRQNGTNFSVDAARRSDETNRSSAYSGYSTAIVHLADATNEELSHLLNYPARDNRPHVNGDTAQERAERLMPTLDSDAHYYVYGNRAERLCAMARLKRAREAFGNSVSRAEMWSILHESDPGAAAVLLEEARLGRKVLSGEMNEIEREAWADISNSDVWKALVKNSGDKRDDAREMRAAAEGGDASIGGQEPVPAEEPVPTETAAPQSGARIVINPAVFRDKRDALCVAFNERFRIFMEESGFEPQSEPTDEQRQFFANTAYADNEIMMRRTILARIATLDTSVKNPTDDQLRETFEMLTAFQQNVQPTNTWEEGVIERLVRLVEKASKTPHPIEPKEPPETADDGGELTARADVGGGETVAEDTGLAKAVELAIPIIEKHEKFAGTPYLDVDGKLALGFGQRTLDGRDVAEGDTITRESASQYVRDKATEIAGELERIYPSWFSKLTTGGKAAAIDLAYNQGVYVFSSKRSPNFDRKVKLNPDNVNTILREELPTYRVARNRETDKKEVQEGLVARRNDARMMWDKQDKLDAEAAKAKKSAETIKRASRIWLR